MLKILSLQREPFIVEVRLAIAALQFRSRRATGRGSTSDGRETERFRIYILTTRRTADVIAAAVCCRARSVRTANQTIRIGATDGAAALA